LWYSKIPLEKVIKWAGENLHWLISKYLIEEIEGEPKRTYRWGQWFKNFNSGYMMQIVPLGNNLCAIISKDGGGYPPIKVEDRNKITERELQQLYNDQAINNLIPINVKITEVTDNI